MFGIYILAGAKRVGIDLMGRILWMRKLVFFKYFLILILISKFLFL